MTACDAAYIALAELLEAPIVTCDAKLARSGGHEVRFYEFAHPNAALHAMAPCPAGESVMAEVRSGPAEIAELTADGRNLTTGS